MNGYSESYDFEESSFEDFDSDELSLPSFLRPGKKVSVPGAGLISATLNTPKGPAKLSLPTPVPTQTQFRQLESALNAQTQRLNAVQAEMAKMRRELVIRRREQTGQGSSSMMSMLMPIMLNKKLKDDLAKHTHVGAAAAAVIPESSSDAFSSILPLLMFAPGILGGGGSTSTGRASGNEQDAFSNPFVMMMLMDAL
jgi:hypothetical protein